MERPNYVGVLKTNWISQSVPFPCGADVAAHNGAVDVDIVAVVPLHELQAPLVEGTKTPVPHLGVEDCIHYQLCCSIAINSQVKHKKIQIVVFSPKWQEDTKCFNRGFSVENGNDDFPRCCLHRK